MKRFRKAFTKAVAFSLSAVMVSFSFQTLALAEELPETGAGEVLIAEEKTDADVKEAIDEENEAISETAQDEQVSDVNADDETISFEEITEENAEELSEDTVESSDEDAENQEEVSDEETLKEDTDFESEEISEEEIGESEVSETEEEIADEDVLEEDLSEIEETVESELMQDGWDSTQTKYYLNGELVKNKVIQIGDEWYGFDRGGRKYDNTTFSLMTGRNTYKCYRAKAGGALYVNEWYKPYSSDPYYNAYYGAKGVAASGYVKVGVTYYLFTDSTNKDEAGRIIQDQLKKVGDSWYVTDREGVAVKVDTSKTGWTESGTNKYYYVVKDGDFVKNAVKSIDGNYYGFDSYGKCYIDTSFTLNGKFYRAKEDGSLYVNEWYEYNFGYVGGYRMYFGDKGVAVTGRKKIDDKNYIFDSSGHLYVNCAVEVDGVWYITDAEGVYKKADTAKTGWKTINGSKYYYIQKENRFVKNQIYKIGDNYYAFDYYGKLYVDQMVTYYDDDARKWVEYVAGKTENNGALVSNEWFYQWYQYGGGDWYYVGSDRKIVDKPQILKVAGKEYLLGDEGKLVINGYYKIGSALYVGDKDGVAEKVKKSQWYKLGEYWYYSKSATEFASDEVLKIGGKYYAFYYSGAMCVNTRFNITKYDESTGKYITKYYQADKDGVLYTDKWYLNGYTWYYYGSDGVQYTGVKKIGGKTYIFYETGELYTSCYLLDNGTLYRIDANGVSEKISKPDGLFNDLYSGYTFYFSNGKQLKNDWKKLNGKWFYFDENGRALRLGAHYVSKDAKTYFFEDDGTLGAKGWHRKYDDIYYTDASGVCKTGLQTIDNQKYVFDSNYRLLVGAVTYNKKNYITDNDGKILKEVKKDGWWDDGKGTYYYVSAGSFVKGQTLALETSSKAIQTYAFNSEGVMQSNVVFSNQVFNKNGLRVEKGWYQIGTDWYYVDAKTHKIVTGAQTIEGKDYYFSYYGGMLSSFNYSTVYYDENGYKVKKETPENGWFLYGGEYTYYKNGEMVKNAWVGNYYLGSSGIMMRNASTPDGYYVGNDGQYVKNTVIDGIAVNAKGKIVGEGWTTIGGKKYYADDKGRVTGRTLRIIDGTLYQFDNSGVLTKTIKKDVPDGWLKIGNDWIYLTRGAINYGYAVIDGKGYYFGGDGYMIKNSAVAVYSKVVYFGSNGAEDKSISGWKDGYYYGQDGTGINTWVNVKGKVYCGYSGNGNYTGYGASTNNSGRYVIYDFNKDGSLKGAVNAEKWIKVAGQWFYYQNGQPLRSGLHVIDKKIYAFTSTGALAGEGVFCCYNFNNYKNEYYYINADGTLNTTKGFRTINGEKCYFDKNGKALVGVYKIDGKVYYLNVPSISYYGY